MNEFGAIGVGLSGMSAASEELDATGNNIANASTSGYVRENANATNVAAVGTTDLTAVQQSMTLVKNAEATVGSRTNELQSLQSQAPTHQTTLTTAKSSVADLDFVKAETELSTQQLTYQAALQATARVLSLSLSEFLK